MPAIVSTNHEMTTMRLWARTQRVSDDTMDLLLGYVQQTNGRLRKGLLAQTLLHGACRSGHICRLAFVIYMTDAEVRM
jgi:hypothetical protein